MLQKNWMELIKPSKMDVNVQENDGRRGRLVAEPLERGFGLTLGNAIRRVLLSSLQGAAITSVKIKGVVHEFSTIPGVKEDLTDILLNLKAIAVKVHSPGLKKMYIKSNGSGELPNDFAYKTCGLSLLFQKIGRCRNPTQFFAFKWKGITRSPPWNRMTDS